MCFSASASFTASAVLGIAGIASVRKAQKPSEFLFASIPFIFSFQQFTEGLVWLTLLNQETWGNIPISIFLFIAQVIWPVAVPLSILLIEREHRRMQWLIFLTTLGFLLAGYLGYCLLHYKATAIIIPYHVHYELFFPQRYNNPVAVIYCLTTVVPPFLSSHKRVPLLGLFNFISFMIAVMFFKDYIVSVWCFFAALISWQIYMVMKNIRMEGEKIMSYKTINNKL